MSIQGTGFGLCGGNVLHDLPPMSLGRMSDRTDVELSRVGEKTMGNLKTIKRLEKEIPIPRCIHVWYIYLHEWLIFMVNVGKYTSPIEHLGVEVVFLNRF